MHSSREELTVTERCDAVFDSAHAMDLSDLEDVRRQEVEYRRAVICAMRLLNQVICCLIDHATDAAFDGSSSDNE